jgi:hypothetical protein
MIVSKEENARARRTKMTTDKQPDPKLHRQISLVKSLLRIIAGGAMIIANLGIYLSIAGMLILVAEIFGILEELV